MTSEGNIYQVCRRLLHSGYGSPSGIAVRVPPLSSLFVNTMTEKGLCRREQDCEQPKNDVFMGKIAVNAWQEFKKMGNRAPDDGGAGEEDFPLCPPFLNKHLTSRLEETIFFLLIYIDRLTCQKNRCGSLGLRK